MSWRHIRDQRPKARKEHKCFLCGEAIPRNETYVRRHGIGGDGPESFAMHDECEDATQKWDVFAWECFSEGDMPRPPKLVWSKLVSRTITNYVKETEANVIRNRMLWAKLTRDKHDITAPKHE